MPDQYGNPTQADVDAYIASHYTPAQRQRILGVQAAPPPPPPGAGAPVAAAPPSGPTDPTPDWMYALGGGMRQTAGNTLTDIGQLTGWQWPKTAAQSSAFQNIPQEQQGMAAHPYVAGAGRVGMGVAETAPLLIGGELALGAGGEALGADALAARVAPWLMRQPTAIRYAVPTAKYMARSGLGGSLALAATGDPNESPESRALWGAAEGAFTGLPFGLADAAAGGGASIAPDVVKEAMKQSRKFVKGGGQAGMPAAVNYVRTAPAYAPPPTATTSMMGQIGQWLRQHPLQAFGYGGAGYEALTHYLPNMDPAAMGWPAVIGGGTWLGSQLAKGAGALSGGYLRSAPYITRTLQRGGVPADWHSFMPYVTGTATPEAYPPTPPY